MKNKFKIIILFLACYFLFPFQASAVNLDLISQSREIAINAQFKVDVILNGEEGINALEGSVSFPSNIILSAIQDSNSIINFWIEKPTVKQGSVNFSGVIPGGYADRNGLVFSLIFKAVSEGGGAIKLNDAKALLNDGQGTQASLTISNFKFLVSNSAPSTKYKIPDVKNDTESPEDFKPGIAKDPDIFNNQWFIVFDAKDKGSGIDHYEIAEERGSITQDYTKLSWQTAESPYTLKDQQLKSYIYIKAVDRAGNLRVVYLSPSYVPWYKKPLVDIIIGLVIVIVLLLVLKRPRKILRRMLMHAK